MSTKKFLFRSAVWVVTINTLVWSVGYLGLPQFLPAFASGGVSPNYLSTTPGMDIMIASSSTMYPVGRFDIFDTYAGLLSNLRVKLKDMPETTGFTPADDLRPLSNTANVSGLSLWRDNGDGQF